MSAGQSATFCPTVAYANYQRAVHLCAKCHHSVFMCLGSYLRAKYPCKVFKCLDSYLRAAKYQHSVFCSYLRASY